MIACFLGDLLILKEQCRHFDSCIELYGEVLQNNMLEIPFLNGGSGVKRLGSVPRHKISRVDQGVSLHSCLLESGSFERCYSNIIAPQSVRLRAYQT